MQTRQIEEWKQKDRERMNRYLKWKMEEDQKHSNRLRIVQMMKLDSQNWYNEDNLDDMVDNKMFIPDVIYDKTDYYMQLQE